MQTGWSIVTAIAALGLGLGLGAGTWSVSRTGADGAEVDDPSSQGAALTFLGGTATPATPAPPKPDEFARVFGILPFATFSEAGDRLEALLEDYRRLDSNRRYSDPLPGERILDEIEGILSLASEAEIVAFLEGREFGIDNSSVADIAFGALARIAPARAADHWLAAPAGVQFFAGLHPVMREWVKRDPAAAEAWARSIPEERARTRAVHSYFSMLAGSDPLAVLSRLDEIDPESGGGVASVLGAKLDLAELSGAADRLLEEHAGGGNAAALLKHFLGAWGERDRGAMLDWVIAQDADALSPELLRQELLGIASEDPAGFFEKISPGISATPSLHVVAAQAWWMWLASDGGEVSAIRWLAENGELAIGFESSFMSIRSMYGDEWRADKAQRILAAFADLPDSPAKAGFTDRLIMELSTVDPEAVLAYAVEHLPLGFRTDMMIAEAVGNWASAAPEAALRWSLENLESEGARDKAVRSAIVRWNPKELRAAAEFSMGLPEKERGVALWELGYAWARREPEEAIRYLSDSSDPVAISSMSRSAFRQIGERHGAAAYFDKALAMPPGRMRHDAVRGLFGGWAISDPEAASAGIERVPPGALRDASIQGFNAYTAGENPRKAMELAALISSPATRERELILRARNWLKQNRAEAEAAIRSHPSLSEAMKSEIFK